MKAHWRSSPTYAAKGVDGSDESIYRYLRENENYCSSNYPGYAQCDGKIAWMKNHWRSSPGYAEKGVDGSMESIYKYLIETEPYCPP
jgi:hypothetical protein